MSAGYRSHLMRVFDEREIVLKKNWLYIVVLALVVGVVAAVMVPSKGKVANVDNQQLTQLQGQNVPVIDVREPSEFAAAHIPGAVNVPMGQLQEAAAGWNKNSALIVYCATGARSANASSYLVAQGFKTVYNLTSGIAAWTGQTETGSGDATTGNAALPTSVKTNGKPLFIDFAGST